MGKKRRMLSSRNKFGAKHSSHPRLKHIMKTEEAETLTAPLAEPEIIEALTVTPRPEIKTAPTIIRDPIIAPVVPTITAPPTLAEKVVTAPVIKKTTAVKKKAPVKKTRKGTTRSKTISRNA
jgi:hypothetical protein